MSLIYLRQACAGVVLFAGLISAAPASGPEYQTFIPSFSSKDPDRMEEFFLPIAIGMRPTIAVLVLGRYEAHVVGGVRGGSLFGGTARAANGATIHFAFDATDENFRLALARTEDRSLMIDGEPIVGTSVERLQQLFPKARIYQTPGYGDYLRMSRRVYARTRSSDNFSTPGATILCVELRGCPPNEGTHPTSEEESDAEVAATRPASQPAAQP